MTSREVEDDYREHGFGGELGFGSAPALIVVDVVNTYFNRNSAMFASVENILDPAKKLLQGFRTAGLPIVFTRVHYRADGADGGSFVRKIPALLSLGEDVDDSQVVDSLAPLADEPVIGKQAPSAFFGTGLSSLLTAKGVNCTVVLGLTTSGCVRATAIDAMQFGFTPIVVADAVGDRQQAPHAASLFDLQAKYADVVDSTAVLSWLRDSFVTQA